MRPECNRICVHCGTPFTVVVPSVPKKYCSIPCFQEARKEASNLYVVEATCPTCGVRFVFQRSRHQTYCSRRCSYVGARTDDEVGFWERVDKRSSVRGCWLWTGGQTKGYGAFGYRNGNGYAHRFSYELTYGPIPPGKMIGHHCDTPLCVNPDHLFVCTAAENTADMLRKERQARGERAGSAKITENDVREIRSLHRDGISDRSIANRFAISASNVNMIVGRRTWKHIP